MSYPAPRKHPSHCSTALTPFKAHPFLQTFDSFKTSQSSSFLGTLWGWATSGFSVGTEALQHFSSLNRAGKIRNCFHSAWLEKRKSQAPHHGDCSAQSRYDGGLCTRAHPPEVMAVLRLFFCLLVFFLHFLSLSLYFFPFMCFFPSPGWSSTGEVMTYLPQLGR